MQGVSHTQRERYTHNTHRQTHTETPTKCLTKTSLKSFGLAAETQTEGTTCFSVAPADNQVPDGFGTFP